MSYWHFLFSFSPPPYIPSGKAMENYSLHTNLPPLNLPSTSSFSNIYSNSNDTSSSTLTTHFVTLEAEELEDIRFNPYSHDTANISSQIRSYSDTFQSYQHVTLTAYLVLIIVGGLSANSFVVYASLRYASFSMDKITILFLRHLAITDILMVIFIALPMLYVHMTQPDEDPFQSIGWLCDVLGYIYEVLIHSHIMFYLIIAGHRFIRCIYPFKLQTMSKKQGRICCVVVWCLGLILFAIFPLTFHTLTAAEGKEVKQVAFSMGMAMCGTTTQDKEWWLFNLIYTIILIFLIIILNLTTLIYSTYVNRNAKVKSRNVTEARITVGTMSICVVLSNFWAPYFLFRSLIGTDGDFKTVDDYSFGSKSMSHLPIITAVVNPLIYTVVNKRFKVFLVKELSRTRRTVMHGSRVKAMKQQALDFKERGQHFYSGVRHSVADAVSYGRYSTRNSTVSNSTVVNVRVNFRKSLY